MAQTERELLEREQAQGDHRVCGRCGRIYNAQQRKNNPPRNGYDGTAHNLDECDEFVGTHAEA